jgi:hypothetical protein
MRRFVWSSAVIALIGLSTATAFAQDAGANKSPSDRPNDGVAAAAPSLDLIRQWVKELDSDEFEVRQAATRKLIEAGRAAIEEVAKAAEGNSLEVTSRSIEILAKLLASDDEGVKTAARRALEQLARSPNRSAAQRAEGILNPTPPELPNVPAFRGGRAPIQIQGLQVLGGGGRVRISNNNGQKTIEVDEPHRKVKIEESPEGAIKMSITETVDGKEKTSNYEAKNADELKKNHPDAHKVYEQYAKQNALNVIGNIQIQAFPGGQGIRVMPALPARLFPQARRAAEQIESAKKQLQEAADLLAKLSEGKIATDDIKKLTEQIQAAQKQLDEAKKQLGE